MVFVVCLTRTSVAVGLLLAATTLLAAFAGADVALAAPGSTALVVVNPWRND